MKLPADMHDVNTDRREAERILCSSLIDIALNKNVPASTIVGVVDDVSERGLCVQLDGPLPVGVDVKLKVHGSGEAPIDGRIRHRFCEEDSWFVGIEFSDDYRWTGGECWPEHQLLT